MSEGASGAATGDAAGGLLGDRADRDYGEKLRRLSRFVEPELRAIFRDLELPAGGVALDAGCGAGVEARWLAEESGARVLAFDLAAAHCSLASAESGRVAQASLVAPPFAPGRFDLVWTKNALNHLADPGAGLRGLAALLRPGGRLVVAQSHFLPEMVFAWDQRLEEAVTQACYRAYAERYALAADATTAVRRIVGCQLEAGLREVRAHTVVVERQQPLDEAARAYFLESLFRGYWGEKVLPFLDATDRAALAELVDPASPRFALDRPDFHSLQTLTVVRGVAAA